MPTACCISTSVPELLERRERQVLVAGRGRSRAGEVLWRTQATRVERRFRLRGCYIVAGTASRRSRTTCSSSIARRKVTQQIPVSSAPEQMTLVDPEHLDVTLYAGNVRHYKLAEFEGSRGKLVELDAPEASMRRRLRRHWATAGSATAAWLRRHAAAPLARRHARRMRAGAWYDPGVTKRLSLALVLFCRCCLPGRSGPKETTPARWNRWPARPRRCRLRRLRPRRSDASRRYVRHDRGREGVDRGAKAKLIAKARRDAQGADRARRRPCRGAMACERWDSSSSASSSSSRSRPRATPVRSAAVNVGADQRPQPRARRTGRWRRGGRADRSCRSISCCRAMTRAPTSSTICSNPGPFSALLNFRDHARGFAFAMQRSTPARQWAEVRLTVCSTRAFRVIWRRPRARRGRRRRIHRRLQPVDAHVPYGEDGKRGSSRASGSSRTGTCARAQANYADADGIAKQRTNREGDERIVTQTIRAR